MNREKKEKEKEIEISEAKRSELDSSGDVMVKDLLACLEASHSLKPQKRSAV